MTALFTASCFSAEESGYRLQAIIDFAWPCVSSQLSVVDLQEKYTGLQTLAHLIARFPTVRALKESRLQIFQCLAKGTHTETKKIVNPALDLLLPAWVASADDSEEQQVCFFALFSRHRKSLYALWVCSLKKSTLQFKVYLSYTVHLLILYYLNNSPRGLSGPNYSLLEAMVIGP